MQALTLILALTVCSPLPTRPGGDDVLDPALFHWREALERLELAGEFVGRGDPDKAHAALGTACRELPTAYAQIAFDRMREISTLPAKLALDSPKTLQLYAEYCYRTLAFQPALKLHLALREKEAAAYDERQLTIRISRCLAELGRVNEAMLELQIPGPRGRTRALHPEFESDQQTLQALSDTDMAIQPVVRAIFRRYVDMDHRKSRFLIALKHLVPLLERPCSLSERQVVHRAIGSCMEEIGDEAGVRAWKKREIRDEGRDPEVEASLLLGQGLRALQHGKQQDALRLMRRLAAVFPDSSVRPVAQLHLGALLRDAGEVDQAVRTLEPLYEEALAEADTEAGNAAARRLHIHRVCVELARSYFYDRQWERALRVARQARDKFPADRGCRTCKKVPGKPLDELIEVLKGFQES